MKEQAPKVITISRQLGSGGSYIGKQLAYNLNIVYLDREIVRRAAKQLLVLEEDLATSDERIPSFWQTFFQLGSYTGTDTYIPPYIFVPTGEDVFKVETEIVKRIAEERSAVIIGRCGSHILRDFPNHTSVFLYADIAYRNARIQELYNVSKEDAGKMIAKSDKERAKYHLMLTGKEWTDARQYDIALNTGKIGNDKSVELIMQFIG